MPNTKDFVPVSRVEQSTVIQNDGSVAMVIQTSAVNFDLLSQQEQLAIIGSFAAFLNSLSFSVQILIRSKKLDISHYLNTLKEAERKQHNPLLQLMMQHYRAFVAAIIRDNEVLDKQFYVIIAVSPIELGVVKTTDEKSLEKALTILNPRRDHILKQLSRIGLKSDQLDDERLIRLFYDIYNDDEKITLPDVQSNPANAVPQNASPKPERLPTSTPPVTQTTPPPVPVPQPSPVAKPPIQPAAPQPQPAPVPIPQPQTPPPAPIPIQQTAPPIPSRPIPPPPVQAPPAPPTPLYSSPKTANPFVVEELPG